MELPHVQVQHPHLPLHLSLRLPQILLGIFQEAIMQRHRHAAKHTRARVQLWQPALARGEKLPREFYPEVSV